MNAEVYLTRKELSDSMERLRASEDREAFNERIQAMNYMNSSI
jgi:hypothetical protein